MERKTKDAQCARTPSPEPNAGNHRANGGGSLALWVWRVYFVTMPLTSSLFYFVLGACLRLVVHRFLGFDLGPVRSTLVMIALSALFMAVWFMGLARHAVTDRPSERADAVMRGAGCE